MLNVRSILIPGQTRLPRPAPRVSLRRLSSLIALAMLLVPLIGARDALAVSLFRADFAFGFNSAFGGLAFGPFDSTAGGLTGSFVVDGDSPPSNASGTVPWSANCLEEDRRSSTDYKFSGAPFAFSLEIGDDTVSASSYSVAFDSVLGPLDALFGFDVVATGGVSSSLGPGFDIEEFSFRGWCDVCGASPFLSDQDQGIPDPLIEIGGVIYYTFAIRGTDPSGESFSFGSAGFPLAEFSVASIPEPSAFLLLATGLFVVGWRECARPA